MKKLAKRVVTVATVVGVVITVVGVILALIANYATNIDNKQYNINKNIEVYCGGTPQIRNEIRYQLKYWISIGRPESPHNPQGWAANLSKEQVMAVMMIADGVDPICPYYGPSGR